MAAETIAIEGEDGRCEAWRAPLPPPETILIALEASKSVHERNVLSFLLTQPVQTAHSAANNSRRREYQESIATADARTSKRAADDVDAQNLEVRLIKPPKVQHTVASAPTGVKAEAAAPVKAKVPALVKPEHEPTPLTPAVPPDVVAATIDRYIEIATTAATQFVFATNVISELCALAPDAAKLVGKL